MEYTITFTVEPTNGFPAPSPSNFLAYVTEMMEFPEDEPLDGSTPYIVTRARVV